MGILGNLWGKDYSEVLETGLSDPQSGEALFVAIHNEGRGADVLAQSDLPEVSDVGDYAGFVADAQIKIADSMQDIAGDILYMSSQMQGQSDAVRGIMHSGQVNIFDAPSAADVPVFDEALEIISHEAARLSMSNPDNTEFEAVMAAIANDASDLRQDVQSVLDTTGFSVVNSVTAQLTEIGIPQADIEAAMTPEPATNNYQFNQVAPSAP